MPGSLAQFGLSDNPFDPETDPKRQLAFPPNSLRKPLNIFQRAELEEYFARVGSFGTAVQDIESFLKTRKVSDGPPAILIEGPRNSGVESTAYLAAQRVAQRSPGGAKKARRVNIDIRTENYAELLSQIDVNLRLHLKLIGMSGPDMQAIFDLVEINRAAPREQAFHTLFSMLRDPLASAPWLVVVLRPITFERRERIPQLYDTLAPLSIAPIFIAHEPSVRTFFRGWNRDSIKGVALKIGALTKDDALDLLRRRLDHFRSDPLPADKWPEFPFRRSAVESMFDDGEKAIGFVLEAFHGALDIKLSKEAVPDPTITWDTIAEYYTERLKKPAPKKL